MKSLSTRLYITLLLTVIALFMASCSKTEIVEPIETAEGTKKSAMDLPSKQIDYTEVKKEFGLSKN